MKRIILFIQCLITLTLYSQTKSCLIEIPQEQKIENVNLNQLVLTKKFIEKANSENRNEYKNNFNLLKYLREANSSEKRKKISKEQGTFFLNEKIYQKESNLNSIGLFIIPKDFKETYNEMSMNQNNQVFSFINPSFQPLNVNVLKDKVITLVKTEPNYFIIDYQGRKLILYKESILSKEDYFMPQDVFKKLSRLNNSIEQFKEKEILIENGENFIIGYKELYKQDKSLNRLSIQGTFKGFKVRENSIYLILKEDSRRQYEISLKQSQEFKIYDSKCVEIEKNKHQLKQDSIFKIATKQLNLYAKGQKSIYKMKDDTLVLNYLKKQFNYKYDKFDKKGSYTHKNFTNAKYDQKYLSAYLNDKGRSTMVSHYHSKYDWLFHTQVKVLIGSKTYTSSEIKSFDPNNSRDNSGGSIWERIYFTNNRDNGILKAIATNCCDKETSIRFNGSKYYHDEILNKTFVIGFRDTYVYSMYLKSIK